MTARKRIPYAANGLLDQASADIAEVTHELMVLVKSRQVTPEERIGIPAAAVVTLAGVNTTLHELRALVEMPVDGAQ
jgi:hypothetical protein